MRFKLRDRIRVKRAVLKSPVREIRTQGSVRGQLGNWLFYLDCFVYMVYLVKSFLALSFGT